MPLESTIPEDARDVLLQLARQGLLPDGASAAKKIVAADAAYVVTQYDSGALIQSATDSAVITLGASLPAGTVVTVQNTGADGAALVSISPAAADKIVGTVDSVQSDGALDKDWQNTKATANQGDFTTLVYDGVDTWWIVGGVGVWASEA